MIAPAYIPSVKIDFELSKKVNSNVDYHLSFLHNTSDAKQKSAY